MGSVEDECSDGAAKYTKLRPMRVEITNFPANKTTKLINPTKQFPSEEGLGVV